MGRELHTDNMYVLLKDHIQNFNRAYKRYAAVVNDEALRKFFHSMYGQEEANLDDLEELSNELKACPVEAEAVTGIVRKLNTAFKPESELTGLERIEFLKYMLEIKKLSKSFYQECEQACQTVASAEFLHSLYEEEKRHIGLLQDRFELEQLLH